MKLSSPQQAMLERLATEPELTPGGNRAAARSAANWYRTLAVLENRHYATRVSAGGGCRASITGAGRSWLLGHTKLICDPPHMLTCVERWTCSACGRALLKNGSVWYGSATEEGCVP